MLDKIGSIVLGGINPIAPMAIRLAEGLLFPSKQGRQSANLPAVTRRPSTPDPLLQGLTYNALGKIRSMSKSDSIFAPGQTVTGQYYSDGTFVTDTGIRGTFSKFGESHIQFKIAGFRGIALSPDKAIAINERTGESYTMKIRYAKGKFSISDIKALPDNFNPRANSPIFTDEVSSFGDLRYNSKGDVAGYYINKNGNKIEVQGFMDKKGNIALALSNGGYFLGHYSFDKDGNLQIFK